MKKIFFLCISVFCIFPCRFASSGDLEELAENHLKISYLYMAIKDVSCNIGEKFLFEREKSDEKLPAIAYFYRGLIAWSCRDREYAVQCFKKAQEAADPDWLSAVTSLWIAGCLKDAQAIRRFEKDTRARVRSEYARVLYECFNINIDSENTSKLFEVKPASMQEQFSLNKNLALIATSPDTVLKALLGITYNSPELVLYTKDIEFSDGSSTKVILPLSDPAIFQAWARYHLNRALSLASNINNPLIEADIRIALRQWKEAEKILGRVIEEHPNDPLIMTRLNHCKTQQGLNIPALNYEGLSPENELKICFLFFIWEIRTDEGLKIGHRAIQSLRDKEKGLSVYAFLKKYRNQIWPIAGLYLQKAKQSDKEERDLYLRNSIIFFDALFEKSRRGNLLEFDPLFLVRLSEVLFLSGHYEEMLKFIYPSQLISLLRKTSPKVEDEENFAMILARAAGQLRPQIQEILACHTFNSEHGVSHKAKEPIEDIDVQDILFSSKNQIAHVENQVTKSDSYSYIIYLSASIAIITLIFIFWRWKRRKRLLKDLLEQVK